MPPFCFEGKSRRAWVLCRGQRERVSWSGVGVGRRGTLRGRVAHGMAGRWSEGRRQPIIHRPGVGAFVESSLLGGGVRWDQRGKKTEDGAWEVPDAGFGRACPQTVSQGLMRRRDDTSVPAPRGSLQGFPSACMFHPALSLPLGPKYQTDIYQNTFSCPGRRGNVITN